MNKLWLIIKREYLTRVRKRSFILTTLLTPLAIALFALVAGLIMAYQSDKARDIMIIDQAGMLDRRIKDQQNFYFQFTSRPLEELRRWDRENNFDGILVIPPLSDLNAARHTIYYYSNENLDLDAAFTLQNIIQEKIRDYKIKELALDAEQLARLKTQVTIDPEPLTFSDSDPGKVKKSDNPSPLTSIIGAGLGGIMGFVMYMIVFINGVMVMRSVMEEKMNRVVEVMISSVRPFYLMLGKIIGVGGVGLTQIIIWSILIPLVVVGAKLAFGIDSQQILLEEAASELDQEDIELAISQIMIELKAVKWWIIIPCFILFFIGGYIIYASLFAAIGSAMSDDLGESQALSIPITIPVILALYIMFVAVRVPDSPLAIWASIFPFFSPIVMPARLAFGPPAWQILLSLVLLFGAAIFCVWISGRIYRVGILMYGKKGSFREIWKWMMAK